ncbi:D-lactaldehyde dehydrogenase [Gloeophyllum trabeum ATCC 11539]|uniref:D-lactaldehyde dehydrogenase n=1 Tax=Gloeophyllum trabeum (strain ATCC 11539 / FP-39264 / Madison 617) TaxID=670483 RepID=S7RL18_GLOTA|nr:D-lactaldehyde dehydrogenase [Gloeophyllum trabeum ATCC 11539]EPQ55055.1 D-lactaldehyde dehydrogenase [Gloeophyllum trabeum ATCC 11539]
MSTTPQKALITGVTSYIGAHIAQKLLQQGWSVRGTVRNQAKARWLHDTFKAGSRFETVEAVDIQKKDSFAEAVKGVDVVFHVASPFFFDIKDPYEDLIHPAINGTTALLAAVHENAPSVKRVVVTSSYAANMKPHPENPNYVYTEEEWNDDAFEQVKKEGKNVPGIIAYIASKNEAERAAWRFVEQNKPKFELAVINPVYVFGPAIHHVAKAEELNTSVALVYAFLNGSKPSLAPKGPHTNYVDVRDVAEAHIKAATLPEAAGQRFILSGGPFSDNLIAAAIKKAYPQFADRLPKEGWNEKEVAKTEIDNSKSRKVLGIDYISLDKSIADTVESIKQFVQ